MIAVESLPRLCVALGAAKLIDLETLAFDACDRGEEFLELRLDLLDHPAEGLALIGRLRRRRPDAVLLVTCRLQPHAGGFAGSIEEQHGILDEAASAGAQLVDVEIETAEAAPQVVAALREKTRVVLSFHDFAGTPAIGRALRRMRKIPADVYKLATMARKPSDNARLLAPLGAPDRPPLTLLGMSETGAASRILGPARGAAFTFAAPDAAEGTAPGQFAASAMRNLYQAHKRTRATKVYGVIADPVAHSLSPTLHNRAFRHKRVDACYLPFLVAPQHLTDFFRFAQELPVAGFSVTIPHKQRVLLRLDGADELARRIGAVNTVYRKQGKLWGTNTDAEGVVRPLERRLRLKGARALVVGYGGAARAAAFSLADRGAQVAITGRDAKKARSLASACGAKAVAFDKLDRYDLLVQCTPVGMRPNVAGTLFPDDIPAELVFDMVYTPLETALLQRARELGTETIEGLEMFIEQAAAQFELWTRETAPAETMREAVLEVLLGAKR